MQAAVNGERAGEDELDLRVEMVGAGRRSTAVGIVRPACQLTASLGYLPICTCTCHCGTTTCPTAMTT